MKRQRVVSMAIVSASIVVVGIAFAMALPKEQREAVPNRAQGKCTLEMAVGDGSEFANACHASHTLLEAVQGTAGT